MPLNGKKPVERDPESGRFRRGNTCDGREKLPSELKEAIQNNGWVALKILLSVMNDPEAADRDRIRAAEIILDRGYGKPTQAVDIAADAEDGGAGIILIPAVSAERKNG